MAMNIRTFFYSLKEGILSIFKNRLMSVASIGTISACLIVINIFYIVGSNVEAMVDQVQNNIGMSVFFEDGVSEEKILDIKELIEIQPQVHSVEYTSAEQAWATFKTDFFEDREELLAGFAEVNPLEDSASIQIFLSDITRQAEMVGYLEDLEAVRHIREDREITDIIKTINELIRYISIVLIGILLFISLFLISNTVRIGIEVRKKQINIMKFIGATDSFIRGPFLVEGALIGLLGAIIPLALIYYTYNDLTNQVVEQFSLLADYMIFLPVNELLLFLGPLTVGIGMVIGIFGSMITIRKHLRV